MNSDTKTPSAENFYMPAEWAPHQSVWLAWPSAAHLWLEDLKPAQDEFVAFAKAIVDIDPVSGHAQGESLNVLVPDVTAGSEAERRLAGLPVKIHLIPFGDIWLRDTAPLFLKNNHGEIATLQFKFNSWGQKYNLPHDSEVAGHIAKTLPLKRFIAPWICEGGSLELDGEGTCLTTRQCLLNTNRNPQMSQEQIETLINEYLGTSKVLWLGDGLINDHTDGHIDTVARYVAPGHIAIHKAMTSDDPNKAIIDRIDQDCQNFTDAKGRKLKITYVPSPGAVLDEDGELMPASHLNFYIANTTVIVPTYGTRWDEDAVRAVASCFPDRKTVGLSAKSILTGGGAFHCISQQQPV